MEKEQAQILAIVSLTAFAIQRANEILDPLVMMLIRWAKTYRTSKDLPGGMTDADFKKAVVATMSFVLGMLVVACTGIRLLEVLDTKYKGIGDFIITALVVGAGTEAVNTVVKFFGYVKDAQKPQAGVDFTVAVPGEVKVGTTFQFYAIGKDGGIHSVTWLVLHGAGGAIDTNGLYTAPTVVGKYAIRATSVADPTKFMTVLVNVVA